MTDLDIRLHRNVLLSCFFIILYHLLDDKMIFDRFRFFLNSLSPPPLACRHTKRKFYRCQLGQTR